MPFRFCCSVCGATVHQTDDLSDYMRYCFRYEPDEKPIITGYIERFVGLTCPKCGNRLATVPREVRISYYERG